MKIEEWLNKHNFDWNNQNGFYYVKIMGGIHYFSNCALSYMKESLAKYIDK